MWKTEWIDTHDYSCALLQNVIHSSVPYITFVCVARGLNSVVIYLMDSFPVSNLSDSLCFNNSTRNAFKQFNEFITLDYEHRDGDGDVLQIRFVKFVKR